MNILFYTPVNFRCRDIESLAEKFIYENHKVFFLTQCAEGPFHDAMRQLGAEVSTMVTPSLRKRIFGLIRFSRSNKIDVCFSHLEPTNFICVLAQYFVKTRFIIYRHHLDAARFNSFDHTSSYRLTYKLAKTIVCVSRQAREYAIKVEGVKPERIFHIDLGYNFKLYGSPDPTHVDKIKKKYRKGILLLAVGRLTTYKRPELSLELVKKARESNLDCSIIFLGVGEDEVRLRQLAVDYSISDRVSFIGYAEEVLDYMAAADLLVHPSVSESSCVVVKEASLVDLPVIVCRGVGDFDDYMKNGVNGITLSRDTFIDECIPVLSDYSRNQKKYKEMAIALRVEVTSRFSITRVYREFKNLVGL